MNKMQAYIYEEEKKWFLRMEPFLQGKILKVGNGLGYLSNFIEEKNKTVEIIDIQANKLAENKSKIKIYNGINFPFDDKSFDCVICAYVLHHTDDPLRILREMKRVSKRVIILEETYDNIFSKLDLVYRDVYVNFCADQPSSIHWNSYFCSKLVEKKFSDGEYKIINHQKEKKRLYWKELFVLE